MAPFSENDVSPIISLNITQLSHLLLKLQPGSHVTWKVANAQYTFLCDAAPYLNQAIAREEKTEFMAVFYRVFFERWPQVVVPGEDSVRFDERMVLTRKVSSCIYFCKFALMLNCCTASPFGFVLAPVY